MKRIWLIIGLFGLAAVLALAATTTILTCGDVTGGGDASSSGNLRLSGAIDGFGLPDGYGTFSQGNGLNVEVGQGAALAATIPQNAADPAWLHAAHGL